MYYKSHITHPPFDSLLVLRETKSRKTPRLVRKQVKVVRAIRRCLLLRVQVCQLHVCEFICDINFGRCGGASDCSLGGCLDTLTKVGVDTSEHSCESSVLAIFPSIY